jgi:hypothetical protein
MQKHNLPTKKKMKKKYTFFLFKCEMKQQRENPDKHKTKKTKQNSGLKHRLQGIRANIPNGNQESIDTYACLKTIKQDFFLFYLFYQLSTKKKQAKGKRP